MMDFSGGGCDAFKWNLDLVVFRDGNEPLVTWDVSVDSAHSAGTPARRESGRAAPRRTRRRSRPAGQKRVRAAVFRYPRMGQPVQAGASGLPDQG